MALQELQIYGLWAGKQTARGTPNDAPARRFKHVAGPAGGVARADGAESYSDLTQLPDTQDWIDSILGNAAPGVQGTPAELAWLLWAFEGGETTSAVVGPPAKTRHTTSPLPGVGHWSTWATRKGSSVVERRQHNDCQISQIEIGGSTGSKAVRVTPTLLSLDPAQVRAADPVAVLPPQPSLLYTDGTGRFTIDGTVFRGHTEFTLTLTRDLGAQFGDDIYAHDLSIGNAQVGIGVSLHFDADGLAQWNKIVYGNANPAAGTKPLNVIGGLGSYGFDLRARTGAGAANGDTFKLGLPGIRWAVPDVPEINPEGGVPTITLAGSMRKVAGQAPYTIDVDCDAPAFTV